MMNKSRLKFKIKYLAIPLLAALLLGNRGFRSLIKNYSEYRRLKSEKAALELQKTDLQKQLEEVREKPAIEQAARKGLGLIRPDETEYRFPPPEGADK